MSSPERISNPIPRMISGISPPALPALGENGGYIVETDDRDFSIKLPHDHPILSAVHTTFDVEGFATPRSPLIIGTFEPKELPEEITVSDMVIKWPGIGYRVPSELIAIKGLLQQCASFEESVNPQADEYYAHLTLQKTFVEKGKKIRGEGPHSDSIQGPRVQPKVAIEHGYMVVDLDPPRFFTHGFDLSGFDPDIDWLNNAIDSQADQTQSIRPEPGEIAFFDAYSIHEAVPAEATALRTFIRVTYSVRPFDRKGNTINKLFDYDWDFQPRPVPPNLSGMPIRKTSEIT